jgi:hypothetical protein
LTAATHCAKQPSARPNTALEPTPDGRVRVRRVPRSGYGGSRGAARRRHGHIPTGVPSRRRPPETQALVEGGQRLLEQSPPAIDAGLDGGHGRTQEPARFDPRVAAEIFHDDRVAIRGRQAADRRSQPAPQLRAQRELVGELRGREAPTSSRIRLRDPLCRSRDARRLREAAGCGAARSRCST